MTFHHIDHLVTEEGFCLQVWGDRYSHGVWAALGLHGGQVDIVRALSISRDADMTPEMEYVLSPRWLPYVTGPTLAEAMQKLEDRLATLPQDQINGTSHWAKLVSKAIDALGAATRERAMENGYQPKPLYRLPEEFLGSLSPLRAS